jgi:hypothetical protein
MTGTGMGPTAPLPNNSNPGGKGDIGNPPVSRNAALRRAVSSAREEMKLGMRSEARSIPMISPDKLATESVRTTANGSDIFHCAVIIANKTPEKAAIEPTLKSISAAMITMVIPTPMIAIIDIWRKTLIKFRSVKKFGAARLKYTHMMA